MKEVLCIQIEEKGIEMWVDKELNILKMIIKKIGIQVENEEFYNQKI